MKVKVSLFIGLLSFLVACGETGVESGQPAIIPEAPTISSFAASPDTLEAGQSSTLTWELAGGEATSVTISSIDEVTGNSTEVTPDETTTYTLTVRNESGSDSATQTITVTPADEPEPAPPVQAPVISSFAATPDTIEEGQSSTLTWELTGGEASSITVDNGVGEVMGNSAEVTPNETTTYTLTAMNEGGEDTAEVTLTVSGAAIVPPEDEVLQAGDLTLTEEGPFIEVDVFGADDTFYPSEGYTFPEIEISSQPSEGQAFAEDGAVFYDSEGFVGTMTFEYTLSITNEETDEVLSDSGTVTLNVQ